MPCMFQGKQQVTCLSVLSACRESFPCSVLFSSFSSFFLALQAGVVVGEGERRERQKSSEKIIGRDR